MMTLHTYKDFMDGLRDAYLHAVEKHPKYTDRVTDYDTDTIRELVGYSRDFNDNGNPTFASIIQEEIAEYIEASLLGDTEAAKRELLDCAAVIMREWERITQ